MTPYYADDLVTIYHGDCRDEAACRARVAATKKPWPLVTVKRAS